MRFNVECSTEATDIENYVYTFRTTNKKLDFDLASQIEQPLKFVTQETKSISIKIPSNLTVTKADVNIETGNKRILKYNADSLSITEDHGVSYWDGEEYVDNETTLSFKLTSDYPGKTTFLISIAATDKETGVEKIYEVVCEAHVRDKSSNMPTGELDRNTIHPSVVRHVSRARTLAGKPFYDSAEFARLYLGVDGVAETSLPMYFGIETKSVSELFKVDEGNVVTRTNGTNYSEIQDFSSATIWWETAEQDADGNSINLQPVPLELANEFKTTNAQKNDKNFVPDFTITEDGKMTWRFINYVSKAAVTAGITNVKINGMEYAVTSGTIEGLNSPYDVDFEYDFNGVTYRWEFRDMDNIGSSSIDEYRYSTVIPIVEGKSVTNTLSISDKENLNSVRFVIGDTNIASASPESFTSFNDANSFTLNGKAIPKDKVTGETKFNVVYELKKLNGETPSAYNKYRRLYRYDEGGWLRVNHLGFDIKVFPFTNPDTTVTVRIHAATLNGYATGNEAPYYFTGEHDDEKRFWLDFERAPFSVAKLPLDANANTYEYERAILESKILTGKITIDGGTPTEIIPILDWSDFKLDDKGTSRTATLDVSYRPEEIEFVHGNEIDWEIPGVQRNNSANIVPTERDVLSRNEQKNSIHPSVAIIKKGVNVESYEWFFVDKDGNRVKKIRTLNDNGIVNIRVNGIRRATASGQVIVNEPGILFGGVSIEYDRADEYGFTTAYTSRFRHEGTEVFSWDVTENDAPIIMRAGYSKTLTINSASIANPVAFVGDSDVVGLEEISRTENSVKIKLSARKAGMSTLVLGSSTSNALSLAKEVWVADIFSATGRYQVPNLTDYIEIYQFVEDLTDTEVPPVEEMKLTVDFSDGVFGEAYSGTATVTGGTDSYTWNCSGLPDGITFEVSDATLTASGTPTEAGIYDIELTVTDSSGETVNETITIEIKDSESEPDPLAISVNFANGTVGEAYSGSATVTGGTSPYDWSYSGLPDGITVETSDATLTASGTPETSGSYELKLTVTDNLGETAIQNVTIEIRDPAPEEPTINTDLHSGSGYNKTQPPVKSAFAEYKKSVSNFTTESNQKELKEYFVIDDDEVEVSGILDNDSVVISENARSASDVSTSDIPSKQQLAVVLREIEVKKAGIYTFNVTFSELEEGMYVYWHSVKKNNGTIVADVAEECALFNAEGNRIDTVPADKNADVTVYLEAGSYAPMFTTDAAGSEEGSGGQTPDNPSTNKDTQASVGGSGGGCSTSVSMSSLALLGLFFIRRRK